MRTAKMQNLEPKTQQNKEGLMQVPILDLKTQYATYEKDVLESIRKVCQSQSFALGPAVAEFEEKISAYCGCKHAIGVSSGTDAILASLMALEIGPGHEVITSPFTFFATAGSIVRVGAKPVFVDIDPRSYNIDVGLIEEKITSRTRAIIPVHLFGQMAQMKPIAEIASRHNLFVIEDAAQSMGATQDGIKCGNLGHLTCFSFYPTKNLGGFGDGGLITTNDDALANKVRILRNHGQDPIYFYKLIGGNFRLDSIQAAVLTVKLQHLDTWNQKRRQNAAIYDRLLTGTPVHCPKIDPNNVHVYHQYTTTAPKRDELHKFLADRRIGSAIFYPKPLHLQQCFLGLGYRQGDMPVSERLSGQVLSLPVYPELRTDQIEYVAESIQRFYGSAGGGRRPDLAQNK